jgi:hypothetical protein
MTGAGRMPARERETTMNTFIDTAVTATYRGYEIRDVSDAINPMTGTRGVGGPRLIIKKNGKILNEQSDMKGAKDLIDGWIATNYRPENNL